jgi:hypothetical protein
MKIATIDSEFVELKGDNRLVARGEGSTTRTAIARAIGNLLRDPKVRRKRITHFRATVTIQTKS